MKLRILTACAVAALAVGTGADAQELPAWNPQTICTEDATPEHCNFLEGQARSQISQQWQFMPSLVRERCLKRSAEDDTQSWRVFGDCIAESARQPRAGEASTATASTASGSGAGGTAEMEALRAELETAQSQVAELEAAAASDGSGDAMAAEARVTELEAELAKARTGVRTSEVRIEGLQQRLMAAAAGATAAAAATSAAAGDGVDVDALQSDLDKAESRARAAEFRTDALESTLKEIIASSKATKSEDDAALEKADTELKRSNARIEGLQERLLEARDAADAAATTSGDGAERLAELEAALEKAETDNKRSTARIEGLQQRLIEANEAAETAVPASGDTGSDERIAALETELEKANAGVRSGEARIEGLQQRLVETMKMAEEASTGGDADERIAALEADLEKANAGVRSGEARIEGLQQRLLEANERADASSAPSGDGDEIAGLRQQLDTAQSRIENLQTRLRNGRDALADTSKGRATDQRNLEGARTRIMALQDAMITARKASEDKMAALEAELAQARDTAASTASASMEGMVPRESLDNLLANQGDRAARVAATVSAQREKIDDLETEVSSLRRMAETVGVSSCQQRMNDVVGSGGIQFENNKADIRADAARTIDRLIAIARDCEDTRITVKGHTDAMGDRGYNLGLSERRAAAVVAYMEQNGIAPSRIASVGVGPDEPIADNNTRAGRAQNRRIELLVE